MRGQLFARVVVALAAVLALAHAVLQGGGSFGWWAPCFAQGYDSEICAYLQYQAPSPWWHALLSWWIATAAVVVAGATVAVVARLSPALAGVAALLALLANPITDYIVTPAVNGGYTSADDAPGFGLPGAVLLAASAVLLAIAALRPARPRTPSAPVTPRQGIGADPGGAAPGLDADPLSR